MAAKFPDKLDHAAVLEFSDFGNFGTIKGDGRTVCYFAICQYPNDTDYYLFLCADDYDVIIDCCMESMESCKKTASLRGDVVWHRK